MKRVPFLPLLCVIVLFNTGMIAAADRAGCKDHPILSRYQGSTLFSCEVKDFDEFQLPLGKFGAGQKQQRLEGTVTQLAYDFAKDRSTLEVMRNYESALAKGGFQTLFSCALKLCGFSNNTPVGGVVSSDSRYVASKLPRPSGDVYAAVHVTGRRVYLRIIEMKPMDAGLVSVNADAMAGDISRTGHVAVYGILFDVDKAEVKAESEAVLKEIAALMKKQPKLALLVVGHTDITGELAHNIDLSRRRAESVVKVLTAKHAIDAKRLRAQGVGPLAPVATNRTEEGKALNRRVDLVEQ